MWIEKRNMGSKGRQDGVHEYKRDATRRHTHTRVSRSKSSLGCTTIPWLLDRHSRTLARLCGAATGGETGKAKSEDKMR